MIHLNVKVKGEDMSQICTSTKCLLIAGGVKH